jgi:hypothetical protein
MPLAAAFHSLARPRARLRSPRSCPCSCSYHLVCAHVVVCSLCAKPRHLVPARLCWFQPVRAGPRYLLVHACSLVLPFVCTRLVLRVRLPSAHVLTCVRSCWSRYLLVPSSRLFAPLRLHVRTRFRLSCRSCILARFCCRLFVRPRSRSFEWICLHQIHS